MSNSKTSLGQKMHFWREDLSDNLNGGSALKVGLVLLTIYLLLAVVLGIYWSRSPELFSVTDEAEALADAQDRQVVTGTTTTAAAVGVADRILSKPGGYLRNDKFPPGLWLDNTPAWEYGALIQLRDLSKAMREGYSRSKSQSTEDLDLSNAEPRFNFKADSWILPSTESVYFEGKDLLLAYHLRLADPQAPQGQFYARADNLRYWLGMVSSRLGSLSQRLSASVGQKRVNIDLAGDAQATQSTPTRKNQYTKTPWLKIDDVFYEARGTTWALIHFLRAVEVDFAEVLQDKNAAASVRQIIQELEKTQDPVYSPLILNGGGFGMMANHSLVMASYISRANAGLIDLRALLTQG